MRAGQGAPGQRARASRIVSKGLEAPDGAQVGQELESSPRRRPGLEAGHFRVIAAPADGQARELKRFRGSSSRAVAYFRLAAVAGCFARVELQVYTAEGWRLTSPVVRWRRPERVPGLEVLPLFAGR